MTSPSSTLGPPLWHAVNMVGSTLFESTPLLIVRNPPLIRNSGGACRMGSTLFESTPLLMVLNPPLGWT